MRNKHRSCALKSNRCRCAIVSPVVKVTLETPNNQHKLKLFFYVQGNDLLSWIFELGSAYERLFKFKDIGISKEVCKISGEMYTRNASESSSQVEEAKKASLYSKSGKCSFNL